MCGRPINVLAILEMVPYLGTRSDVLKMALAMSISVSEKRQNTLDESTHTTISTISMHMMMQYPLASNRTIQENAPT